MRYRHWLYLALHGLLVLFGVVLLLTYLSMRTPSPASSTATAAAGSSPADPATHQTVGDTVVPAVATSLIAAGFAGWVIFAYILLTDRKTEAYFAVQELGIVNAFPVRSAAIRIQYENRLRSARNQIDIIGFGLRALREDLSESFPDWTKRAQVRILLLDPRFPQQGQSLATIRDGEENDSKGTTEKDVRDFVRATKHLIKGDNRFTVRLYQALPTVNMFRVDNEAFWGPYVAGRPSRNTPTFIVKSPLPLFAILDHHFETLWTKHAVDVPAAWLEDE